MSKIQRARSQSLRIQERDVVILRFLDRVGYANIKQIAFAIVGVDDEKVQNTVLRRIYLLKRFGYIKSFSSHIGIYFALNKAGLGLNAPINSIKLDQLKHHNFLIELFFLVHDGEILSERECISEFKVVGKKGKVPDMVINDCIIEFERTNKSVGDCRAVVDYWTVERGKDLCIIYETEQIKNRYMGLLNPRVKLLARTNYHNILDVIGNKSISNVTQHTENGDINIVIPNKYLDDIKNKYL